MSRDKPNITLDMSGLPCPAPLLGAKRVLDDLEPGQSMLLISDCPGTADDLHTWARLTGNEVRASERLEGASVRYTLVKGVHGERPRPNVVLDMRGVSCPGPIVEAKKLLDGMSHGEVLLLVSNCPGAPDDVGAWAATVDVDVLSRQHGPRGLIEFYLRKR